MPNYAETPDAREQRRRLIVKWHARAHDRLDREGVPRMADGIAYTLEERIGLALAAVRGSGEDP